MEKIASADLFLAQLARGLNSWPKSRRALVAVSGGRDSTALLYGLHTLGFRKLVVTHLNHRLRGRASTTDARFVERMAQKLSYRCVTGRADVHSYAKERTLSIEHAAREMRQIFFARVASQEHCRAVFLAHHADDQVETCLFNFLRGAGAAGMAGMRPESTQKIGRTELKLFRPMLAIRRSEIETWLRVHKLAWREDVSNLSLEHTRNRLRQRVLPVLTEQFGPSFSQAILRAATIHAAEDDWMRSEVEKFVAADDLSVRNLTEMPLALRRRAVRQWLKKSGVLEAGFSETERVLSLLDVAKGPAQINLPGDIHARRREGRIFLEHP